MARQAWEVEFHPDCEAWADHLPQPDKEALLAAKRILESDGPTLGRPLVDTVVGSRHSNMKELRPGSTSRSEIRLLFAFDLEREAILLVGGDKSGNWTGWYEKSIPVADDRFDHHQAKLKAKKTGEKRSKSKGRQRKGKGRR